MEEIKKLENLEKEASLIGSISSVLSWDQQCVMPKAGNEYRSKQMAYIAEKQHEKDTSPEKSHLLERLQEKKESLDHNGKKLLELAQRKFDMNKNVPSHLISQLVQETSKAYFHWDESKKTNDDSKFLPQLEKIIQLTKEKASYLGVDRNNLYNNMLSEYEWGMTCDQLDVIFDELKEKLPLLVKKITKQGLYKNQLENITVPFPDQEKINYACLDLMGFDKERCYLGLSSHPFSSTLGQGDYRITTWNKEDDFLSSYLGTAHEMGHSLYEQGLPSDLFGTSLGNACSFGWHESQSLFWEKKVATSRAFLKLLWPIFSKAMKAKENRIDLEKLYYSINQVKNSLIRVDSDEVTYCLHIIIRYEMEKALINEDLPCSEIESFWNSKYKEYLGITAKEKKSGYLQDVHWSYGAFGYFPSYALGHLISSQIEEKLKEEIGPLENLIEERKTSNIIKWLNQNVHEKASFYTPKDLVKNITGKDLSSLPFINYLEKKFV